MKLTFRLHEPKTESDRLFSAEAEVNELKSPGEAYVVLDGKEYRIQVEFN